MEENLEGVARQRLGPAKAHQEEGKRKMDAQKKSERLAAKQQLRAKTMFATAASTKEAEGLYNALQGITSTPLGRQMQNKLDDPKVMDRIVMWARGVRNVSNFKRADAPLAIQMAFGQVAGICQQNPKRRHCPVCGGTSMCAHTLARSGDGKEREVSHSVSGQVCGT